MGSMKELLDLRLTIYRWSLYELLKEYVINGDSPNLKVKVKELLDKIHTL